MNYRIFLKIKKVHAVLVFLYSSFFLISCATVDYPLTPEKLQSYGLPETANNELTQKHAPIFIVEEHQKTFNRIGTPSARYKKTKEEIYIDPEVPSIYFMEQPFTTLKGSYNNLIYRVHFEKIPFSLIPFHLTTGKNIGLIVVVTLNDRKEPVLLTVVNTCGCYLSITPTSFTPKETYPDDWNSEEWQWVYGEYIPAYLDYTTQVNQPNLHPTLLIRSNNHRVKGFWLDTLDSVRQIYEMVPFNLAPMDSLENLSINGEKTSFFETHGSRKGYVKNSSKPLERLLMSWWVFDWRIGEDKKLGPGAEGNSVFYTSVKFWARKDSDMWNFPEFLQYWGWKL